MNHFRVKFVSFMARNIELDGFPFTFRSWSSDREQLSHQILFTPLMALTWWWQQWPAKEQAWILQVIVSPQPLPPPHHKHMPSGPFPSFYVIYTLPGCFYMIIGVHDSYWTHACDVEKLNSILREKFVELYKTPILENVWFLDNFPFIKFLL